MIDDYYDGALGNLEGLDKIIFERALEQWTERPQLGNGYNKTRLKLYDALIWTRVINAKSELAILEESERARKKTKIKKNSRIANLLKPASSDSPYSKLDELKTDIDSWKYTGEVFRVIECKKEKVEYHQLIASWTNSPEVFKEFNHLYENQEYTFLIAETREDWAFDVNKYRKHASNRHIFTEHESEIILPMDKKYIVDTFYGTLEGFYHHIEAEK